MAGNGAIAGLVGITAPSGFVEYWAAPIIGLIAGVIVVFAVLAIDKKVDDPVGALSAHGVAGVWGTLACGLFSSPRLISEAGTDAAFFMALACVVGLLAGLLGASAMAVAGATLWVGMITFVVSAWVRSRRG